MNSIPSVVRIAMKVGCKMLVAVRFYPVITTGERDKEMEGVGAKAMTEDRNLIRSTLVYGVVLEMVTVLVVVVGLMLILLVGPVMLERVGVRTVLQVKAMSVNPLMKLGCMLLAIRVSSMIVAGYRDEDVDREGEWDGAKAMVVDMGENMNIITTDVVVDGAILELEVTTQMVVVGLMLSLLVGKIIQARVGAEVFLLKEMTEDPLIFGSRMTMKVGCLILVTSKVPPMRVAGAEDREGQGKGEEEGEGDGAKVITKDVDVDVNVIITAIAAADGAALEVITLVVMVVVVGPMLILLIGEVIKKRVGVRVVLVKAMAVKPLILAIRIAMNVIRTAMVVVAVGEVIREIVGVRVVLEKTMAVEPPISAVEVTMKLG